MYRFARTLVIVVGSGLLLGAFLLALGIAITDYLVGPNLGNGLGALEGEKWYSGRAALLNAQLECGGDYDEPTNSFLRRKFRVVEMELQDGFCPLEGRNAVQAYQARVQAYTLFMIPTDNAFVQCIPDDETPLTVNCYGPPLGDYGN